MYDFLYHDSRRVGSFLAQLGEVGHLTQLKQSELAPKGGKRGFGVNVGGTVAAVGGGQFGIDVKPKSGGSDTTERVFDPYWTNAVALLTALSDNGMIRDDIDAAPLGAIVQVRGGLNIIDLAMIKALWALPSIQRAVYAGVEPVPQPGSRQERRARARQASTEPRNPDTELFLEVLPTLPHTINMLLSNESESAWGTMDEEYLVGSGSDIVLKHGSSIPGRWNMLGIVDGRPDFLNTDDYNAAATWDDYSPLQSSVVGQVSKALAPIIRLLLGRPSSAYAVTPILVFRQTGGDAGG